MGFATLWDDEENDGTEDLSEEDQKIRYTPAPTQIHFFTYEHCWIGLHRQLYKDVGSPWVANMEKLYIYAAPWRKYILKVLLHDIQDASIEHDNNHIAISQGLKMGSSFQWMRVASKKPRPLSTIVFDLKQKKCIIKDVQDYIDPCTCSWYQSQGLLYQQGYLFYGAPSTGKSSLCLGIASLVQLNIFMISLSANDLDKNSLALLFQSLPMRCVVLFEDMDQAGIRKHSTDNPLPRKHEGTDEEGESDSLKAHNHEQRSNGITLAVILNIIDGVSAQEGRILVMTTNHIEQLDPALLRPGHVNLKVPFGHTDRLAAQEHFLAFYLKPADTLVMGIPEPGGSIHPLALPASPDWVLDDIVNLSVMFANAVASNQHTAAEIQNYLLQYWNYPMSAAHDVADCIGQTEKHEWSLPSK